MHIVRSLRDRLVAQSRTPRFDREIAAARTAQLRPLVSTSNGLWLRLSQESLPVEDLLGPITFGTCTNCGSTCQPLSGPVGAGTCLRGCAA